MRPGTSGTPIIVFIGSLCEFQIIQKFQILVPSHPDVKAIYPSSGLIHRSLAISDH
jgi:hypothetical protein